MLPTRLPSTLGGVEYLPARSGADFAGSLPSGLCAAAGNSARFSPAWTQPGSGGLAYCVYGLKAPVSGSAALQLEFSSNGPAPGTCFIGLSEWDAGVWRWFDLPGDGTLQLADTAPYSGGGNGTLAAIALTGTAEVVLSSIGFAPTGGDFPAQELLDIQYVSTDGADPELQQLDVYIPEGPGPFPVLLYIHGGGWQNGDKRTDAAPVEALHGAGFVFATTNYRLSPDYIHPAHIEDCAAAFAHLYENAADYRIDTGNMYVMGHSAGAHLAALLASDARWLGAHTLPLGVINGAACLDTSLYDLVYRQEQYPEQWVTDMIEQAFTSDEAMQIDGSPASQISDGAGPFLLIYVADRYDTRGMSRYFQQQLRASGVWSAVLPAPGKTHSSLIGEFGDPGDQPTQDVLDFLAARVADTNPAYGFERMAFATDYPVGADDGNGGFLGGTEIMYLTPYGGKLFAANGYWKDEPGSDPSPGAQVLTRDSADSGWRVEQAWGSGYVRIGLLQEVEFTTDRYGNPLSMPVHMLVASPHPNPLEEEGNATIWVRNDASGGWTETVIAGDLGWKAYVRAAQDHYDAESGVHYLFAGVATSALYRGAYDPAVPGGIYWYPEPELVGTERIHALAEANGRLYASVGTNGDPLDDDGGLYLRTGGAEPSWELLYEWPLIEGRHPGLRGLTAVPGSSGSMLLGTRENEGVVELIDPSSGHSVALELDYHAYFTNLWGGLGGSALICAYNEFTPTTSPYTGEQSWLGGLFINHPENTTQPYNGAWFLVRDSDGQHTHGHVYDYVDPVPAGSLLRAVRTICPSPFPEEAGRVYYFGGFDAGGNQDWHNTAWIYRGELP